MTSFQKSLIFIFSLYIAIFLPFSGRAAMTSTNYQIRFDSVGVGGNDTSTSTSYKVRDSLEFIQGTSTSSSYQVDQGYRGGVYDPTVEFSVAVQEVSSQVAATAITTNTVTVTSAADFAAGDYLAVVQNEGLTQVSAVGRVESVAGSTITVDFFQYSSVLPTIDGSDDYVYELNASTISFAAITPTTTSTAILAWEVDADIPTGYNVYVREGFNLRTLDGYVLNDVDDGAVTEGFEEYGGRSSDATLGSSTFDTQDSAFTTDLQQVASRTRATLLARDFLTIKVAAAETTVNGAYGHVLTVVFVGNY